MRLQSKVAFISGGARGMGEEFVRLFIQEGAKVGIGDILETEGRDLEADIAHSGGESLFVSQDVTRENSWQRAIEKTVDRFGKLDILVNNAGISSEFTSIEDATLDDWNSMLDVNASGVFLGMKHAIPQLRKSGGGSIVNISSVSGMIGRPNIFAGYNASKGAVRLMTKSAAIQYAKDGIRVNSVHPGPIVTPMTESLRANISDSEFFLSNVPLGRFGEPYEIAYGVLYLASDESSYVTGSELVIDGGATAH